MVYKYFSTYAILRYHPLILLGYLQTSPAKFQPIRTVITQGALSLMVLIFAKVWETWGFAYYSPHIQTSIFINNIKIITN